MSNVECKPTNIMPVPTGNETPRRFVLCDLELLNQGRSGGSFIWDQAASSNLMGWTDFLAGHNDWQGLALYGSTIPCEALVSHPRRGPKATAACWQPWTERLIESDSSLGEANLQLCFPGTNPAHAQPVDIQARSSSGTKTRSGLIRIYGQAVFPTTRQRPKNAVTKRFAELLQPASGLRLQPTIRWGELREPNHSDAIIPMATRLRKHQFRLTYTGKERPSALARGVFDVYCVESFEHGRPQMVACRYDFNDVGS